MTGNQILNAYSEIVKNDLFPVLAVTSSGVDSGMALHYINVGARRLMRSLRRQAKATFTTSDGVTDYNIQTATSKRFFELSKVSLNASALPRTGIDDDSGYALEGDTLTFHRNPGASSDVILVGYIYGQDISASDVEVSDIPVELHLAIAQFAAIESCGSHDIDPTQQQRLMNMQRIAEDAVLRQRNREAMNSFPERLRSGSK